MVYKAWGSVVDREYKMSLWKFRYYKLVELLKNPIYSLVIFFLGQYSSYRARINHNKFDTKWTLVGSTKDL